MSFPFKIPFAASGDQSTVPDSDLTGGVNFTYGYTPDYQADPSLDPNAKLIERDKFNFLMNKATGAIGEIQRQGSASWYSDLAPYDLNAEVFYNGKRWRSTAASNSATPGTSAAWVPIFGIDPILKTEPAQPAFKVSGSDLQVNNGFIARGIEFADSAAVTLPALVAATDYKIFLLSDGSLSAQAFDTAAPAGSLVLGGFHVYHTTGTINPRSIWDIKFRPSCNPRGMTLSPDSRLWVDIYLMDVDYGINRYSRPNATIADGVSLPKIPAIYGGNGAATYPAMTWYSSWDLAIAAGKRLPFYGEFTGFAYGVVERQAVGTDPVTTKYQAGHRSACGVEQVTGCLWQWGADINGTTATGEAAATWQDIAGGRGDVYTHSIRAVLLGAAWGNAANAGSRASGWGNDPVYSNISVSARGVCDHQIL